ncbi:hypothetical protein HNY73_009800 [Argiope bruennichi]|uniref:Uncharacterized protein n=1 Tax=Argiope bruennichi TaxID=94029 RepID=A0A8T0FAJ1_ARGBR|nr:hypothetical protein HNY73_009800 [Argiope bruennichi]
MDEDEDIQFIGVVTSSVSVHKAVKIKTEPGTEASAFLVDSSCDSGLFLNNEPGTKAGVSSVDSSCDSGLSLDNTCSIIFANVVIKEEKREDQEAISSNFTGEVPGSSFTSPSDNHSLLCHQSDVPTLHMEENRTTFDNTGPPYTSKNIDSNEKESNQEEIVISTDHTKPTEEQFQNGSKELISVPIDESEISNFEISSESENYLFNETLTTNDLPIFPTEDAYNFDFQDFENIMDSDSSGLDHEVQSSKNALEANDSQEMSPLEFSEPVLACTRKDPAEKIENLSANVFRNSDISNDTVDLAASPASNEADKANELNLYLESANTEITEDASATGFSVSSLDKARMEPNSCLANEIRHLGFLEIPTTVNASPVASAPRPTPTLDVYPLEPLRNEVSSLEPHSNGQRRLYIVPVVPPLHEIVSMSCVRFSSSCNDDMNRNAPTDIEASKESSNDNDNDRKCVPKYRKAIAVHEKNKMLERNREASAEKKISTTPDISEEILKDNRDLPTWNTSQNEQKNSSKYIATNNYREYPQMNSQQQLNQVKLYSKDTERKQRAPKKSSFAQDTRSVNAGDQTFQEVSNLYTGGSVIAEASSMQLHSKGPERKRIIKKRKKISFSEQDTRSAHASDQTFQESSNYYSGGSIIAEPSTMGKETDIFINFNMLNSIREPEENSRKKKPRKISKKTCNLNLPVISSNKRGRERKPQQHRSRKRLKKISNEPSDIIFRANHDEAISQLKSVIRRRKENSDMDTKNPKKQKTKSTSTTLRRKNNLGVAEKSLKRKNHTAQSPVTTTTVTQDLDLNFPSFEGRLINWNNKGVYFFINNANVYFKFDICQGYHLNGLHNTSASISSSTTQNYFDCVSHQAENERLPTVTDLDPQSESSYKLFLLEIEKVTSLGKSVERMLASHYFIKLENLETFKTLVEKMEKQLALIMERKDSNLKLIGMKTISTFRATLCSDSPSMFHNASYSDLTLNPDTAANATGQVKSLCSKEKSIQVVYSNLPKSELISKIKESLYFNSWPL